MAERSYRSLIWTLVLLGATLDQASKYLVFKILYNGGEGGQFVVIPGVFKLLAQFTNQADSPDHVLWPLRSWSGPMLPRVNHGALFGIRLGLGDQEVWMANIVFAAVSLIAAAAIAYWSTRPTTARDRYLCAALGLILAGTLGNLYDRVVFNGVRDFFYFHLIEWPVFNFADCCLVCGAGLLLLQAFQSRSVARQTEAAEVALSPLTVDIK